MAERPTSHGLGIGHGSLIDYHDGTVEYRQTGKLMPAFKVLMHDISGFSVRQFTREDRRRFGALSGHQVLSVQGSGTTLAEVPVLYGTAEKIEQWFRMQPGFLSSRQVSAPPNRDGMSVADELTKLAQLRDAGILSPEEFAAQKAKLLG
ncbi:hypothetical protein Val02_02600 [Virgisporangium aliadipatigenens]|uniref:SHOCT domain-containing protein n=1 Tax=Virgisporangium aliadipatigenens TaxID=741659 RepID=A0A8J4DMH1_9ACTN|nr:SHOCT domain-containing protein [Virgisporangium aliadipatigenens]GIJ43374.1 hypothetical protein Val02_02600 [Virgisporangium aliadipatigenens]